MTTGATGDPPPRHSVQSTRAPTSGARFVTPMANRPAASYVGSTGGRLLLVRPGTVIPLTKAETAAAIDNAGEDDS